MPPICAPVSFDDATAVTGAPVHDAAAPDVVDDGGDEVELDAEGELDAGVELVGVMVGVLELVVQLRLELVVVVIDAAAVVDGSGKVTAPVGGTISVAIIVACVSDAAPGSFLHMSYASETTSAVEDVSTTHLGQFYITTMKRRPKPTMLVHALTGPDVVLRHNTLNRPLPYRVPRGPGVRTKTF